MPYKTFFNLSKEKKDRIIEAAIDEFAKNSYENAKLSNIIRQAKIPRGSIYQYFENKDDLYLYIIELIKDKKMEYLEKLLKNEEDKPFLNLFKELYIAGINFAAENPKFIKIFTNLLNLKGKMYNKIIKDSIVIATTYYINYIKNDQEKGRIRKDISPEIFAKLVIDLTMNISIENIKNNDYDNILERVNQIINIIEHGVTNGERDV
ncbi:MAG: hypothetical protein B6I17_01120 [Tenericutes bacterium 4572_104]|nr:MAG: hypothetical protein B6I17_01120 [Tenericutes bacterium 4572_104]